MNEHPEHTPPQPSQPARSQYEVGLDEVFPTDSATAKWAGFTPAEQEARNQRSTRQAFIYFFSVPVIVFTLAGIIMVVSRMSGGPLCESGQSQWLCTRASQIWFSLVPGLVSLGSVFLAGYITYHKWRTQQRWRWWIAVVWLSMPFALAWITGTGSLLLLGH